MPGEENAAPAVGVLARVGFLYSACSDVVAKPEEFSRQSVDARLSASKLLQSDESGPMPKLNRGEKRPRAVVQVVEAGCLSFGDGRALHVEGKEGVAVFIGCREKRVELQVRLIVKLLMSTWFCARTGSPTWSPAR